MQELPHPAYHHLLPEGEGYLIRLKSSSTGLQPDIQHNLKNPRPFWERGNHRRWWVRDLIDFIKIKRSVNWQKSPTMIPTIQESQICHLGQPLC
ncbi:MAG: hypothetical protein CL915_04875 [Deltaproteobacteria bacterium]|nr:hypothetical protein [Deltaproteobacteria bacterium]